MSQPPAAASSSSSSGLLRKYKRALGWGAATYAAGLAGLYLYAQQRRGDPSDAEREQTFDRLAPRWERVMQRSETMLGMEELRAELLAHARGETLEVGAGTGRNLTLYPPSRVTRLMLTDASPGMAAELQRRALQQTHVPAQVQLAAGEMLPFVSASFDTVVQTHVLCSVRDPSAELVELLRVCRPGGRLLLLEHGRAGWWPLDWYLDLLARTHARQWGCWWNRDVAALVRSSLPPGAQAQHRTAHLGSTHLFVIDLPAKSEVTLQPKT